MSATNPVVYDKASYHQEDVSAEGLPETHAFHHTGMFLGWLIDRGLIHLQFEADARDEIALFRQRKMTGPQVYQANDGVLTRDMLSEVGNDFSQYYYDKNFSSDYVEVLADELPSAYHPLDTWENYALLKKRLDERYESWKRQFKVK